MATQETDKWQELEKELAGLRESLAEIRSAIGAVRALSASSLPSPERRADPSQVASESSETGNDHQPVKMTFEEFANESGLKF